MHGAGMDGILEERKSFLESLPEEYKNWKRLYVKSLLHGWYERI